MKNIQAIGITMRRALFIIFLSAVLCAVLPHQAPAASPYSIGFVAGGGLPVGWWADRWGFMQSGEINLRYEIQRGVGFFLLTGLSKSYYQERSKEDIAAESSFGDISDEFLPYRNITTAEEGGAFKQLPVGCGFYGEGLVAGFRTYGSAAFVVNLWKFERGQTFEETIIPPASDTLFNADSWQDVQDGSNVGLQLATGVLIPIRTGMFLDASLAYHFTGISDKNMAVAYWGKPARTWSEERKAGVKNHADFIALRLGVRFGG